MGMIINPFASADAGITLGNTNTTHNTNISAAANNQVGNAYQASVSGTLNYITVIGSSALAYSTNYRMCIYAATSQTVWSGAKLGETAVQNSLGINEVKKVALLAPVSVVAGNWYAITFQAETTMANGAQTFGLGDRFFADTYSDGALATALASGANSANTRMIYASTS